MIRVILALLVMGCTSSGVAPVELGKTYKKSLHMQVNDRTGIGMMTVPLNLKMNITIQIPQKAEILRLSTCHREETVEKTGWQDRKSHTWAITLIEGIETIGECPIRIDALDLEGESSWGFIDIVNEEMYATLQCNGVTSWPKGVSVCQSREGLLQRIVFDGPTESELVTEGCPPLDVLKSKPGYNVTTGKGVCVYLFMEKSTGKFHRLTTFGYNSVLLKVLQ
jgi:hypothetical protein